MRTYVVGGLIALACTGCSQRGDREEWYLARLCGAGAGGSVEGALLSALQFPIAPAARCTAQPAGTPDAPQPLWLPGAAPVVLHPGGTLNLPVTWHGGAISGINLGVGGGAYLVVPVANAGREQGSSIASAQIASSVCDDLPATCHALVCCQQVVTPSGKVGAAVAQQMVLDCTGGGGCGALGYPSNPCPCDPTWEKCKGFAAPCGIEGGDCCDDLPACRSGLRCDGGTCIRPSRATGQPCAVDAECLGEAPRCLHLDGTYAWWDGYCTSACDPVHQQGATNPDCPGSGTCLGGGGDGRCFAACTDRFRSQPCRPGYACFYGPGGDAQCWPQEISQCRPSQSGSCAAGFCERIGPDDVGRCGPGCDPLAQNCPLSMGCYAALDTGRGTCMTPTPGLHGDHAPCAEPNGCDRGFGCVGGQCRPYCSSTDQKFRCAIEGYCLDLSPTVKAAQLGACGP